MTTTGELVEIVYGILKGATDAGDNVYLPRTWATYDGAYPYILIQRPSEHKESQGRGDIGFTVTSNIRITARASRPAEIDQQAEHALEADLDRLARQIEVAVLGSSTLYMLPSGGKRLSQFPTVDTQLETRSDGKQPIGELQIVVAMEFYQGAEDFIPAAGVPLTEVDIDTDMGNVFDPTGTYPDPLFPDSVLPAPRTSGPDGRVEGGGLKIILPGG